MVKTIGKPRQASLRSRPVEQNVNGVGLLTNFLRFSLNLAVIDKNWQKVTGR
jgi:hypothetical protein